MFSAWNISEAAVNTIHVLCQKKIQKVRESAKKKPHTHIQNEIVTLFLCFFFCQKQQKGTSALTQNMNIIYCGLTY